MMQDIHITGDQVEEILKSMIAKHLIEMCSSQIEQQVAILTKDIDLEAIAKSKLEDVIEHLAQRDLTWGIKNDLEREAKALIEKGAVNYTKQKDTNAALLLLGQERAKEYIDLDKVKVDIRVNVSLNE